LQSSDIEVQTDAVKVSIRYPSAGQGDSPSFDCSNLTKTSMKWPPVGSGNARTSLLLVDWDSDHVETASLKALPYSVIISTFPWLEYIVRVGWDVVRRDVSMPDAGWIWIQAMDRAQQRLSLIFVTLQAFGQTEGTLPSSLYRVLDTQSESTWITVTNHFTILPSIDQDIVEWLDTRRLNSNHRHLYRHRFSMSQSKLSSAAVRLFPIALRF
jgi:hypothetical protein